MMNPIGDGDDHTEYTEVPGSLFETPMQALGASGGTAAFFKVQYKDSELATDSWDGEPIPSKGFWIGKDLSRARDEVAFYEQARQLKGAEGWDMLRWMTPYKGVVKAPAVIDGPPVETEVMLLRNARDQFSTCRLLDVKIGEVTAVAGWQGKSSFMAWTQKWLDGITNSNGQGFRLEGFDNPPSTLQSVFDHADSERHGIATNRLHRIMMQRQPASTFLRCGRVTINPVKVFSHAVAVLARRVGNHCRVCALGRDRYFIDFHDTSGSTYAGASPPDDEAPAATSGAAAATALSGGPGGGPAGDQERLLGVEMEELVLLNCIEELAALCAACRVAPVPQQWIGSSVMLAFDSDLRPLRTALAGGWQPEDMPVGAAASIACARVQIFDWGRSELNTPEMFGEMSKEGQHSYEAQQTIKARKIYWGHYCGGLSMLLYDCCLVYSRRFLFPQRSVSFSLWDQVR